MRKGLENISYPGAFEFFGERSTVVPSAEDEANMIVSLSNKVRNVFDIDREPPNRDEFHAR